MAVFVFPRVPDVLKGQNHELRFQRITLTLHDSKHDIIQLEHGWRGSAGISTVYLLGWLWFDWRKRRLKNRTDNMDTKVDFTCSYHEEGNWHLIRPENEAAQKELDDNVGEYGRYLMRWYDHNGDSWWIRVAPGPRHAWTTKGNSPIYTSLKRDPNELVKKLFEKGFKLALDKTNWKPKQHSYNSS